MPRFESGTCEYDVGMLASVPQRTVKSAEEGKGEKKERNDLPFVTFSLLEWTLQRSTFKVRYRSAISAVVRTFVRPRMIAQVNRRVKERRSVELCCVFHFTDFIPNGEARKSHTITELYN